MTAYRNLGDREKILWLFGRNEPFNIQWTVSVTGEFNQRHLEQALLALQKQHPFLRSTVSQDEPLRFIPLDKTITLHCFKRIDDSTWRDYAERALEIPVSAENPESFLNVQLISDGSNHEIIFTIDHAFSDGQSLIKLIEDCVCYLADIVANKSLQIKSRQLLPPLEDLLPKIKDQSDEKYHAISGEDKTLAIDPPPYTYSLPCHQVISKDKTKQLIEKSKSEKCSVHGALCSAMSSAYIEYAKQAQIDPPYVNFTPADCRSCMKHEIDLRDLGNFASGFAQSITPDSFEFWPHAKQISAQAKELKTGNKIIENLYDFSRMWNNGETSESIIGKIKSKSPIVGVSNIGKITLPDQIGSLKINDLFCAISSPIVSGNPHVFWLIALTWNNRLVFDLYYSSPYISKAEAKHFMSRMTATLF